MPAISEFFITKQIMGKGSDRTSHYFTINLVVEPTFSNVFQEEESKLCGVGDQVIFMSRYFL